MHLTPLTSVLLLSAALCACGGASAESAGPGQAPACANVQSGRVLSLELSLQPVGEGSTPAPPLRAVSAHRTTAQALPATFAGETVVDVEGEAGTGPLHLTVPDHFAVGDDLRVGCGDGCTTVARFERRDQGSGSIDANVALPADLGGPHHVLHVHAPAEITVSECH